MQARAGREASFLGCQIAPSKMPDPDARPGARATRPSEHEMFPRPTITPEKLATLKPAFKPQGGVITAGNSSGVTDGAAAVLVSSRTEAARRGTPILGQLVDRAMVGVAPETQRRRRGDRRVKTGGGHSVREIECRRLPEAATRG